MTFSVVSAFDYFGTMLLTTLRCLVAWFRYLFLRQKIIRERADHPTRAPSEPVLENGPNDVKLLLDIIEDRVGIMEHRKKTWIREDGYSTDKKLLTESGALEAHSLNVNRLMMRSIREQSHGHPAWSERGKDLMRASFLQRSVNQLDRLGYHLRRVVESLERPHDRKCS